MSIETVLRSSLTDIADKPLYLAYSGGIDSQCLLHLLASLRVEYRLDLTAVHIHHGLQSGADDWLAFCKQQATELDVDFESRCCELPKVKSGGIEAAAREARYRAFAEIVPPHAILLTAQHQDDQAETLLLQLLRGAGPKGASAMPAAGESHGCQLHRPLLSVSRQQIERYAREHQLAWCEDPSNQDKRFDRNYLRHQVMPTLRNRWPQAAKTLSRSAYLMAESQELMDELAALDTEAIDCDNEHTSLDLKSLAELTVARQRNVLRFVLRRWQMPMPSLQKLDELRDVMLHASVDAQPQVRWGNVIARRFQRRLYLSVFKAEQPLLRVDLQPPPQTTDLGQGWQLGWQSDAAGISERLLTRPLYVDYRQGGEQFRPAGEKHHKPLKHWLQIWQVPPWQRSRIPLIYSDDQLVAVTGFAIAAESLTGPENTGWKPLVYPSSDGSI